MKKIIFLLAISFGLFTSCKKESLSTNNAAITVVPASSVPASTIATLTTTFPGATEVEWHKSGNHFSSQFNFNGQRHEVGFDDNGHQSSHDVICLSGTVPQVVLDAFRTNYATDNVYEWKLQNDGSWKAHFMRGTIKWEVTISAAGVILKAENA